MANLYYGKSRSQKIRLAIAIGVCAALIGCGKNDKKNQNEASSAKPSEAQTPGSSRPGIKLSTVRVEGTGKSFDDALQNALVLAVGRVNGARVSKSANTESLISDFHAQSSSSAQFSGSESEKDHASASVSGQVAGPDGSGSVHSSANADAEGNSQASGKFSSSDSASGAFDANRSVVTTSSSMSGVVRRFQVAGQRQDHGQWFVTIIAEIPVYEGSAASKRMKIAVLPFRTDSEDKKSSDFEQSVHAQVIDALTQSGKVAVLDRDYAQENQGELSQLQSEDFSKDEAAKLGNKLGADYIIVGTVSKAAATQESVYMEAVGKRIFGATHADAQLSFRMIEAATGVVQLSGTLSGTKYAASSLDTVAKAEAADLTHRILDSLFPLRIESFSDGVFYLGKGGDSIHVGDQFRVLKEGSPILDSDTHEVIGHSEKEVGKIVVTEVESKLSKAKLADGSSVQISDAKGLIARPIEQSVITAAGSSEANSNGNQGSQASTKPKVNSGSRPSGTAPKAGVDY